MTVYPRLVAHLTLQPLQERARDFLCRLRRPVHFPDRWGDWGLSPVIRWLLLSG